MAPECSLLECLEELPVVGRAGGVVAARAVIDVLGHGLECHSARLLAPGPATDSVSDHHEESESFRFARDDVQVGQAGLADRHLLFQGADEEVILVFLADLAGMGDTVDIDLIVAWLADGPHNGCGGLRGGHADLLFLWRRALSYSMTRERLGLE